MSYENRSGIIASASVKVSPPAIVNREYEFLARVKLSIPETPAGVAFLRSMLKASSTFPITIDEKDADEFRFEGDLSITSPISILAVGG